HTVIRLHTSRLHDALPSTPGCLAASVHDFAPQPLKVFAGLLGVGQYINGVLDRHRADPLQAAPDLDPEIVGLGRELMDEEQPAPSRTLEDWTLPPTHQRFRTPEPAARRTPGSAGVARRASAPRTPVAPQPLKVFAGLLGVGQYINGVLDRHRADPL